MKIKMLCFTAAAILLSRTTACLSAAAATACSAGESLTACKTDSLVFDASRFTVKTVEVAGKIVSYRAYEGIVTVAKPVDAKYQSLNFFVPVEYYEGKSIGAYTAETAPIFFPNSIAGYMPGLPLSPDKSGRPGPGMAGGPGPGPGMPGESGPGPNMPGGPGSRNGPSAIALALSKGFVVAAPGARGRTLQDETGLYTGKAPACIVDLKAAVRYLRHNDKLMPGDAEKIISNGTSAGGAVSALLGATGNSPDYEPYLQALGAADERDDIFAASCYCPITNLDHADAAYEWLFNGINTYGGMRGSGTLTAEQIEISNRLKTLFPPYLNGLKLTLPSGTTLQLDESGEGNFKDYLKALVVASAQKAVDAGKTLPASAGITIKDGTVTGIDFAKFVANAKRQKTPPAFDAFDLKAPENNLFGTPAEDSRHFTEFGKRESQDHTMADSAIVKLMNPLEYIGADGVATARHWRIRHGAADCDTSLAVPVILATRLQNWGAQVDFAMPWGQGHGGDYDLDELFKWISEVAKGPKT